MRKNDLTPKGFSSKEIQQNFIEESKAKLKPEQARLSHARSRRNLSDALDSGELSLFLQSLDAIGFVEGTPQRKEALRIFNGKHGPHSR